MKLLIFLTIAVLSLNAVSFSSSKKTLLKKIYYDNQNTFYCANPYEIRIVKGKQKALIIQDDKFYTPRKLFFKSGKPNYRAKIIEWEHIMPAHNFGKHLECWQNGGRKACKKDKLFKKMEVDMHNLVPAIGEVNADRSNYKYGADKPKKGQYGNCNMQVDFKSKRAYIRDEIKGNVARAYLYMSEKYNIKLSSKEQKMFNAWDKLDPISKWEITKNQRINKYYK
jgi:deoxyribonuclease-1